MKSSLLVIGLAVFSLTVSIDRTLAQVTPFDATHLGDRLSRFTEIDFERLELPRLGGPGVLNGSLPNPLRIGTVAFMDPWGLHAGFCSEPTCIADEDNPDGGNVELFLNEGAVIVLRSAPRLVVLDVQGMGDNPFVLLVTDNRGHRRRVRDQGVLNDQTLLGLYSRHGVRKIEVVGVGGTGGPLALARLLFWK